MGLMITLFDWMRWKAARVSVCHVYLGNKHGSWLEFTAGISISGRGCCLVVTRLLGRAIHWWEGTIGWLTEGRDVLDALISLARWPSGDLASRRGATSLESRLGCGRRPDRMLPPHAPHISLISSSYRLSTFFLFDSDQLVSWCCCKTLTVRACRGWNISFF